MGMQLFQFDPAAYARDFARDGFVHIRRGVTEEFCSRVLGQIDALVGSPSGPGHSAGTPPEALYEFPASADQMEELRTVTAAVCALDPRDLVLSERHIEAFGESAPPEPRAHKDRFASEISIGISLRAPEGSTLVLYPYDELDVNPFNGSDLLRSSLSADRQPEPALRRARRVEINDAPGDVILFRGHRTWHLRTNPANTAMLTLTLNTMNCDPLGEDPMTPEVRRATEAAAALDDFRLERCIPMIGRRVEYVHRHYNRNWQEVAGVVLWGEGHFTIDELELKALRAMDGKRTVRSVLETLHGSLSPESGLEKIRRLAKRGVLDLVEREA